MSMINCSRPRIILEFQGSFSLPDQGKSLLRHNYSCQERVKFLKTEVFPASKSKLSQAEISQTGRVNFLKAKVFPARKSKLS
jgi:hypothetical protein